MIVGGLREAQLFIKMPTRKIAKNLMVFIYLNFAEIIFNDHPNLINLTRPHFRAPGRAFRCISRITDREAISRMNQSILYQGFQPDKICPLYGSPVPRCKSHESL